MMFWVRPRPAAATVTIPSQSDRTSEAARILSDEARAQKARRTAMLDTLRGCVVRGDVAKLGWRS